MGSAGSSDPYQSSSAIQRNAAELAIPSMMPPGASPMPSHLQSPPTHGHTSQPNQVLHSHQRQRLSPKPRAMLRPQAPMLGAAPILPMQAPPLHHAPPNRGALASNGWNNLSVSSLAVNSQNYTHPQQLTQKLFSPNLSKGALESDVTATTISPPPIWSVLPAHNQGDPTHLQQTVSLNPHSSSPPVLN
eukprot:Filipodium_phascolosomae@DN6198_c0_g1_i1.p1